MSAGSAPAFDADKYGSLFAAGAPQEITTDEENQARIQELEALSFADTLTLEEEAYCKVLAILSRAMSNGIVSNGLLIRYKRLRCSCRTAI